MTSTPGTSLNCANTHKTQLDPLEDRASRAVLSPASIPLSPNYFDALSEEAEPEEVPGEVDAPRENSLE